MNTRREWIYQIRNRFRADRPDTKLSNRMISFELEKMLVLLVRRDSDSRKLWKQTGLFTTQVVELETVDNQYSRSVQALPPIHQANPNPYMQVYGIDGSTWNLSTPLQQAGTSYGSNTGSRYAWLDVDNKLVVSTPDITQLSVRYFAKPYRTPGSCLSELDVVFTVPDHLQEDLLVSVCKNLAAAPIPIPPDNYPNENSQPSAPRQST